MIDTQNLESKVIEHDDKLKAHETILEEHTARINDMRKHGHETNRSILVMNETIGLINNQVNQTLREAVRNSSLLDETRERIRALEEDSITRKAEKNFVRQQRRGFSDLLTISYKIITISAFIIVSILAFAGYAKPEALLSHFY
jgi:hypothetical protein